MNAPQLQLIARLTPTLVLRLTLAAVLVPHGLSKILPGGLWGVGGGFPPFVAYLETTHGWPCAVAFIAALGVVGIELGGSLLLVIGRCVRPTALGIALFFVGIVALEHARHGFFMNWLGTLPPGAEGFELHLLVLGICAALALPQQPHPVRL